MPNGTSEADAVGSERKQWTLENALAVLQEKTWLRWTLYLEVPLLLGIAVSYLLTSPGADTGDPIPAWGAIFIIWAVMVAVTVVLFLLGAKVIDLIAKRKRAARTDGDETS